MSFAIVVLLLIIYKVCLKLTTGWNRSSTCLVGKTAIVTGANTGIGFCTAQDFAKRGARVVLACRDPVRAEDAKTKIIEATGNRNIVVKILDLASLASIRKFSKNIKSAEKRLDILVNNAGAAGLSNTTTSDGLSLCLQTNYFGPFLLTILLLDLLKKSAPSRIVNVSSFAANFAKLNVSDLNAFSTTIFPKAIDYSNSKFCNILFTNELARRLKGTGVNTNSVHPGVVSSDFPRFLPGILRKIIDATFRMFFKSSEEGAQTSIYVALSKDIDGVSGEYFSDCKQGTMPRNGRDVKLAKKVWEKSVEFVKLTTEERQLA